MNVAIRTDASSRIGSGHVRRCKTLADELRRRGASVRFVCREHPGDLIPLLSNAGYCVAVLPAVDAGQAADADATISALHGFAPDWLVVDHYGLDEEWESRLRDHVGRVFVIDDLANRRHACDALLDQNWFGAATDRRYDDFVPVRCRLLLGPRYALLHPLFAQLRRSPPPRDGVMRRLLVFFGAVDSCNQTVAVLHALRAQEFAGIGVDVVVGHANRHATDIEAMVQGRVGAALHRDLPNLAGLMAGADVMAGAGGATTWERCCLGLPAVVISIAENQKRLTAALGAAGVQYSLGDGSSVTVVDWVRALHELRSSPDRVRAYSTAASRLTDGLGVLRMAAVVQEQPIEPRLRRAGPEDEWSLLEWANDPEVREQAFAPRSISPETHRAWFQKKLADPHCVLLIAEDVHGLPIGQVRFDCDANEAVVDISVDPALRGRGVGQALLRGAIDAFRAEGRKEEVVGEVLPHNHASRGMFLKVGFRAVPPAPGRGDGHRFVLSS